MFEFLVAHSWLLLANVVENFSWYGGLFGLAIPPMLKPNDPQQSRLGRLFDNILLLIAGISLLPLAAFFAAPPIAHYGLGTELPFPEAYLTRWMISTAAGVALVGLLCRYWPPLWASFKCWLTKPSDKGAIKRTDVREVLQTQENKPAIVFDPLTYCNNPEQIFFGLDENRHPVTLAYRDWQLAHLALVGRTRIGKGVAAQILLTQALRAGELTVVFDPKVDEWLPHVLFHAAGKAKQPYRPLDLRPSAPPQINPFHGCDVDTLENMFLGGFGLGQRGDIADVYRVDDRRAALLAARFIVDQRYKTGQTPTPAMVYAEMHKRFDAEYAKVFMGMLQELAELPSVNAAENGIDLDSLAASGGCLYIFGDMINARVLSAQRMLLVRLMMLAKNRPATAKHRTITVFADEFKCHISRPFMQSLQAAAGWGLHAILAFQSFQDLADCPADISKESVIGSVAENCQIKLSYAIDDPDTAEWFCRGTGKVRVHDESRVVNRGIGLSETLSSESLLRQGERYFIDENTFSNMPVGQAVLRVSGKLTRFCATSPVIAEKVDEAINSSPAVRQKGQPTAPVGSSGLLDL